MTFWERILELLEENNLRQADLARGVQIREATITAWKQNGNLPAGDIAVKLADFFNVSTDYILLRTDSRINLIEPIENNNRKIKPVEPKEKKINPIIEQKLSITDSELNLILKIRELDDSQKDFIQTAIESNYKKSIKLLKKEEQGVS